MDVKEALEKVQAQLTDTRFEHTKRVVETAIKLAEIHGGSKEKVELAAALHDYAKYRSKPEMKMWIIDAYLPKDLLQFHHELWHGPVGAMLVKRELGIEDREILSAIHYHTTGKVNMTQLEKLVFLADYIEPGRNFPGVDEVRNIAREDLDKGCWLALKNTISFLMSKNQPIYPDTFFAYNDLTKVMKRK